MLEQATLATRFPGNVHVQKLVGLVRRMKINMEPSFVEQQWLYHPGRRTLYVWEPDLEKQSLSYLVVILAHELGHARDFDLNPHHAEEIKRLHWSQTPEHIERAAFVQGFLILKELQIPISLEHYTQMIESPMAEDVHAVLTDELCCLLSPRRSA